MSKFAVLASGSGTNFEALVLASRERGHEVAILICDRRAAGVFERAGRLGIPARYVPYAERERGDAEAEIDGILRAEDVKIVALAGFMRILSPEFVEKWVNRLVNIHPSLLPDYPGAHAIEQAFNAGETCYGVTVHHVDEGTDSGAIIAQKRVSMMPGTPLAEIERRIHEIEHEMYPEVVFRLLESEE